MTYKGIATMLFLFILTYLILRIIFNGTLHDEIATFMFFIYNGDFRGETIVWDANNHLLNSFLGNLFYPLFKSNISLYRLFNLFGFFLFFYGNYKICSRFKTLNLNWIGLLTLTCIPFVIEFFGYCRGYGLSLGFFSIFLLYFLEFLEHPKFYKLFISIVALLLCVSANLTFINTALLTFAYLLTFLILHWNKLSNQNKITIPLSLLFGISILIPLAQFAIELKEHGALYYGGKTGLWEITGKSLSKYIFFSESFLLKYIYIGLFILFLGMCLKLILKRKTIFESFQFVAYLLFGNLTGVFMLAFLFDVNYPEDRAAFYLLILFLTLFLFYLEQLKYGRYIQYCLFIFPILFFSKLSINTSVFYPDDRMTDAFYQKVKKEIDSSNSIMIYPTMNWNWPFKESFQVKKSSVALFYNFNTTLTDVILTKTTEIKNNDIFTLYDVIARDKQSNYIAFKRKNKLKKKEIFTPFLSEKKAGTMEYTSMLELDSLELLHNKNIQINIEGHLQTFKPKNKIQLIVQTFDSINQLDYFYYSFETCFQGQLIDSDFSHHFVLEHVNPNTKLIKIYLWNRAPDKLILDKGKVTFYELND
jgi:hypothetical protein